MSLNYDTKDEVPTELLCERLEQLSDAVTKGKDAILRDFDMRIPAEVDRDADCVLAEAAKRLLDLQQRCQIGWYNPTNNRFCYCDQKTADPDKFSSYTHAVYSLPPNSAQHETH